MSSANPAEKPQRRPQPPPLPEPLSIDVDGKCAVKYVDLKPSGHTPQQPTVVFIHGSPGTYKDFRYLMPLFTKGDVRVIGINLPGFGGSEVLDTKCYYEHISALGEAAIAYEALAQICKGEESVFVVGHSFGGHTALNLAAMDVKKAQLKLRGIGLLASAGYRPHRAMWPVTTAVLSSVVSYEIPVVSSLAASLVRSIYINAIGFPGYEPTSHYVTGLIRCNTTSFDLVNEHVKLAAQLPSFVAWAKDDTHIEEEIFVHMSEQLRPGPRFAFDKAGHNLQKSKADVLATELTRWMEDVLSPAGN